MFRVSISSLYEACWVTYVVMNLAVLSGIHSQQLVCFPIPAAMAELSETLRIYAEVWSL